jgi:uncharacterized sulfatase
MKTKRLSKLAVGLSCLLALSFVAAAAGRPNIVLVFIDDMGWGDFSCFGNKEAKTPNIDRLAAEGLRFEQFYVNMPICSPSRVAISTGQYPQRWRITSYLDNRAKNQERGIAQWLDPQAPMLARTLKQAGYATGHFGKWHMGGQRDVDDAPPITAYGFDESLTNFEGMGPKFLPLTLRPGQTETNKIWADAERLGGPFTWRLRSTITSGFVEAALRFIDKARKENKPFYINLWPDDVHSPFWPPVDKWKPGDKRGMYLAVLTELDRQLGAFFDAIRDRPELRDNTLVLVCSDNGPEAGAGSAGPFKGGKGMLYEGGVRSPLVVWGPGLVDRQKSGTVNRTSVLAAVDLAPTLLAVAGAKPADGVAYDGVQLKKTLLGGSEASRDKPLFFRRPPDRGAIGAEANLPDLAVREGRWKLLCEYDGSGARLYDVLADPGEVADRSAGEAETVARLTQAAVNWHRSLPPDNGDAQVKGKRAAR